MLIVKKASALSSEQKELLGIIGIPEDWPVESYPYTGGDIPEGFEEMSEEDFSSLKDNNQAVYDAWLATLRPIIQIPPESPRTEDNIPFVQPIIVYNEHLLIPRGMKKAKFKASDYTKLITLSNRNGNTFEYSGDLVPEVNAYIIQDDAVIRFCITDVDTDNNLITLEDGIDGMNLDDLDLNEEILLSNPFINDCELEYGEAPMLYLWGLTFRARGYGDDDFMTLRIMFNHPEYGLVPVKEYERTWVSNIDKRGIMNTPDGAPGELPAGIVVRIEYHTLKTDDDYIHINSDFILTAKQ